MIGQPKSMKNLAKFSVKNSLIVNVMSVFIVITGILAIIMQTREAFPRIDFDIVAIQALYPNATPSEMEKLITIPIEDELKEIDNIKKISSVSAEGISRITIELDEDIDNKIQIVSDIQRAVDRAEGLPADLPDKPIVTEIKTKNSPILNVALSGDLPEAELRKHAKELEKRIEDLPGLSKVSKNGYREPEIWVEVTPESIQKNHLSLGEVIEALQKHNKTIPGGKFYEKNKEFILRTTGEYQTKKDIEKTIVRASTIGNWITIDDVAKVKDGLEEETIINKTLGTRSINLNIIKKESGDTITLIDRIKGIAHDYQKTAPQELKISFVNDHSFFIKRRLNVLMNNGLIGLTLVTISLFIFLSLGTAMGAFLGIPTALLMAFALMNIFGITINLISLFGLIMVLGMLVDEDIVISENIYRHIEKGEPPKEAAVKGASEINTAIFATVLTTIAAFLPLFFMGGIMGKFTRNIPIVVIFALVASLTEAILILPSHISDISTFISFKLKKFAKPRGQKFFEKLLKKYDKALRFAIKRRYVFLGSLVLVFIASIMAIAFRFVKYEQFPSDGIEVFFIRAEGELGDSLKVTENKFRPIEKIVATLPKEELETFVTQIGIIQMEADDPKSNRASHIGQVAVYLTPPLTRERKTKVIIDDVRERVLKVAKFKEISFEKIHPGPPVGSPVSIQIRGESFETLGTVAKEYKAALQKIKGIVDIDDDFDAGKNEKHIVVNTVAAAQAGLSLEAIARVVRQAFEGFPATQIKTPEEEIDIVVKFPHDEREKAEALEKLLVPNQNGQLIHLNQVATFQNTNGLHAIKHIDHKRAVTVFANIEEDKTTTVEVNDEIKKIAPSLKKKYPGISISYGGEIEDIQESMTHLFTAFIWAALLIGLILIAMFHSLIQPLIIMITIPFSIIGVVIAFMIHGKPLSFMAVLGLIGLTGIVVNGAIIMIDFINRFRAEGHGGHEAIIEGSKVRLRAVLLTGITTVLGVLPAAYGLGGRDPFIVPMAMALNYGIVFSTFLTLIYVPIFLVIVDDVKNHCAQRNPRLEKKKPVL